MKHARIHIFTILLLIGLCGAKTSGTDDSSDARDARQDETNHDEFLRLINVDDPKSNVDGESRDDLPVLPPIILLDFGNGTADENATFEEKSKRTVNNGIGYGIEKNTLQPRRYNYYFPGGKTGTTVSIEESISPFLPKTIIEKIQPDEQRNGANKPYGTYQNLFDTAASLGQSQTHLNFRYVNPLSSSNSESVFGLRTKLQKTPSGFSLETYRNHLSTPKPSGFYGIQNSGYKSNAFSTTTPSSLSFGPAESIRYTTPSPSSYVGSQGSSFNHPTSSPFSRQPASSNVPTYSSQRQNLRTSVNPQSYSYQYQNVESSTASPADYNSQFANPASRLLPNTPRYTTENGVRYENKIFWKYPDGRVSDVPPATYVETYSEYPDNTPITEEVKSPSPLSFYEAGSENGMYSQGPVKFPTGPESREREPSPFVSADSVSSSLPQQQVYRLSYQNLVTQKHNPNLAQRGNANTDAASSYSSPSPTASSLTSSGSRSNQKANQKTRYGTSYLPQRKPSKYMVNSPNPEYNDGHPTESPAKSTTEDSSFFTPSAGGNSKKESTSDQSTASYPNLGYSDLLNYNPSISQYVRDPSSILNVQPTFVQAGNSLIPVIILRVDGASPVQPKVTPNVNLKALLQQYLIQYAKGIQDLRRPSSYNLGTDSIAKAQNSDPNGSPLLDFLRFTQNDSREEPSYVSNSYNGRSSYETSDLDETKSFGSGQYGERTTGRKKVKNVQILEDPRFASYKAKNWQA